MVDLLNSEESLNNPCFAGVEFPLQLAMPRGAEEWRVEWIVIWWVCLVRNGGGGLALRWVDGWKGGVALSLKLCLHNKHRLNLPDEQTLSIRTQLEASATAPTSPAPRRRGAVI